VAKPVTLGHGFGTAVLEFKALPNCALGTRAVVIRAETKIGKDVIVEYSEPILFTVR